MGRIVAIAGGDLRSTLPINKFIVSMDKKDLHNLLFIGTASEDAEGYIQNIKITFEQMNCCVKALCLLPWSLIRHLSNKMAGLGISNVMKKQGHILLRMMMELW